MKKTLTLLFTTLLISCVSYKTIEVTSPVERVIKVNKKKNELYVQANRWMVNTFNNAESVIQFSDKESGNIMGKYLLYNGAVNQYHDTRVFSIIDIRIKDNKVKISVKPEKAWKYDPSGMTIYTYNKPKAINDMSNLIDDFEKFITKSTDDF